MEIVLSKKFKRKTELINDLLFDDWDPIGVKKSGAPRDHYKRYAHEITQNFSTKPNELEIQNYLKEVFIRCLGEPENDDAKTMKIATAIYSVLVD